MVSLTFSMPAGRKDWIMNLKYSAQRRILLFSADFMPLNARIDLDQWMN